jgi:hypothetical protein
MKTKLFLLSLMVVAALSCSKTKVNTVTVTHDTTVTTIDTPFQTPVKTIIARGGFVDTLLGVTDNGYEFGTEFYSSDTGTISQLGAILDTKNTNFTVTLWDVATTSSLATASVTTTDTTVFAYTNIPPVHISANKLYMISYNFGTAPGFVPVKEPLALLPFPYSVGSITFVGSYDKSTAGFPTTSFNAFITPADFVFKVNN